MKENSSERKSSLCFPLTEPIHAYLEIRKTHDSIHRHVSKKLAQWGLSIPKYGVLMRLYDHDSLYLTELSNLIFRGNSNITTLITRLERDGLVERFNGKDRRVKKVRLTRKGQTLMPKVISEYRAFLDQMIAKDLSLKNLRDLIKILQQIRKSI